MPMRRIVLIFILGCIGLQVAAYWVGKAMYPFANYGMYCQARGLPVRATKTAMFARLPDGRQIEVTPAYMGLYWHGWWQELARWLGKEPPKADVRGVPLDQRRAQAVRMISEQTQRLEGAPPQAIEMVVRVYQVEDGDIRTRVEGIIHRLADPVALSSEVSP